MERWIHSVMARKVNGAKYRLVSVVCKIIERIIKEDDIVEYLTEYYITKIFF